MVPSEVGDRADLLAALEGLGYRKAELLPLVRDVPADLTDTSDQIRWVLKHLGKGS